MTDQYQNIKICRQYIESKLGWGQSDSWQNQDFENLSEKIFQETGQVLSISTLKRIWGKVKYDGRPNIATLDVLAQFAGFENWRAFDGAQPASETVLFPEEKRQGSMLNRPRLWQYLVMLFCLATICAFWYKQSGKKLWFSNIEFNSRPLTTGLPNTVVFAYNARQTNADSVFIQQSWDKRKRQKVDQYDTVFTSTYYIPGYYKAKLVLNDSVVKEHDVLIETNGWMGLLDTRPFPIYLKKEDVARGDEWGFSQAQLDTIALSSHEPVLFVLANVSKDFQKIDSAHFVLNLQLQNTYNQPGKDVCQKTFVSVLGSNGFINIPLCKTGCVGEVSLMLGDKVVSGKTNNLEALGVDFTQKVNLRCELVQDNLCIYTNDKLAFTAANPAIGQLQGCRIAFTGTGVMSHFDLH